MFLRKNGFSKVVGLDLSPTAVKVAQANLEKEGNLDNVEYTCGSFFDWESKSTPTFDFIFDYTFFVAIDPSMRPTWAKSHARCLTPETGTLATLLFPLLTADGDSSKGPPYPVTLSMYEEVLTPLGFELVSVTKDVDSIKPRQGKEMMAYWKLKGAKSGE